MDAEGRPVVVGQSAWYRADRCWSWARTRVLRLSPKGVQLDCVPTWLPQRDWPTLLRWTKPDFAEVRSILEQPNWDIFDGTVFVETVVVKDGRSVRSPRLWLSDPGHTP